MRRRHFLYGAAGVSLGLPVIEAFSGKQASADNGGYPPYAIFMRQANGVATDTGDEPERFWPAQPGTVTQASLEAEPDKTMSVLAAYADKLNIVRGIDFAFPGNGCGHSGGGNQCLTAARVSVTPSGAGSLAEGESIDNLIATNLQPAGVEPLTLYAGKMNGYIDEVMSYRGAQQLRAAERNPYNAYMDLFGLNTLTPEALEKLKAQRQSVNDLVRGEMQQLLSRNDLSKADRERLDLHFSAIRDLEVTMSCTLPDMEVAAMEAIQNGLGNNENIITIARMQLDIIALAVACGAVRAATLQIGDGNDSTRYTVNGTMYESYHWVSHRIMGDGDTGAPIVNADLQHHDIDVIHAEMFLYLLDKLSSYSIGNGTLLDSGISVWLNDLGNKYHSYQNVPYICAGSCNDYLRTGQYLDLNGVNNNKLFNTIANAVGVTKANGDPIDDFGDSSLEGGSIGEMIA